MPAVIRLTPRLASRLAAGIAVLLVPAALALRADDKPAAAHPGAPAAASQPANNAQKARELKKAEEISRVMEFFKVTQPDVYEQAKNLRNSDPARFEKLVRPAIGTVNKLEDLRKKNPKLFDLTMKDLELNYHSLRLARQLKKSNLDPADRDRMTADLSKLVASQFDIRQQIRQEEIEDLKNQLKELDDKLQNNEKVKTTLIQQRVTDLIDKPPRLDW